ncbi:MAG: baeRF3 domain-containing protein, partial [Bacteroidia bacterium]
ISLEEVKLFRGSGKELNPIHNKDFPRKFTDDYEYQRSQPLGMGHGYGLKTAEGDKSVVIEERFEKFLKDTDRILEHYLKNNELLLLAGVKQELGYFQKVSQHNDKIAGKIIGSHSHTALTELGELAFDEVTKARNKLMLEKIKEAEEAFGRELAVTGIDNAWRAAREGKGRVLLVEKDYVQPGFVKPNVEHLFLKPPAEIHDILDDAVESVISTVLQKDGKVVVVENEMLNKSGRITLLLRYA